MKPSGIVWAMSDDLNLRFPEPYVAVIFSSRRTVDDGERYGEMAERMETLARTRQGFLGIESVRDVERAGITVSYWATEADAAAWKQVAEHLGVQRLGRERWYETYTTRVATVTRSYAWSRDAGPDDTGPDDTGPDGELGEGSAVRSPA